MYLCIIWYQYVWYIHICITYQVDVAWICGPTKKILRGTSARKKRTEFFMWLLARLIWSLQSGALNGSCRFFLKLIGTYAIRPGNSSSNHCFEGKTGKPLSFRGKKLTQRYLSCFFSCFFNVHMFLFFVNWGFEILSMFFSPSFQH